MLQRDVRFHPVFHRMHLLADSSLNSHHAPFRVSVRGYIQCNHRNSTAIGYVPYLYGSSGSNSVNGLYGYNNGRPWPQSTYDASNPPVEVEIIYDTTAPASVMREDLDIKTPNGGFRSVEEGFSNWYFMGGSECLDFFWQKQP
jgi:hypothetical protein